MAAIIDAEDLAKASLAQDEAADFARPNLREFNDWVALQLVEADTYLVFPTLLERNGGALPIDLVQVSSMTPPAWRAVGAGLVRLTPYSGGGAMFFKAYKVMAAKDGGEHVWPVNDPQGIAMNLESGTYALVSCHGEPFFRCLDTAPTAFGVAGGHPVLASEGCVLFPSEIEVGSNMELLR